MPKGRSASQAGRRGTALVSVAVGSRGRVFLVARLCLRFSARVALRGFPVPSSPWPPGSLPALCPFSPPAACRSSLPRAAHRLLRCWPPRLGPNPAPPSGGVAAGHAGWPGVRVPMARAFGTASAAPRVGPGGRPEGLGRPFRRVAGESGFRGLWPRATGCGGGGAAGIAEGLVGRSRCHVGPSSCSEAAGGEIPACVLVAVGCARGVPRRPPPRSAACLARRLVFSRPALPHRVGARPRPGCASLPRPAAALPRGVCLGRCRRRGGGPSSPRVALPRSARACARVRPGGPSRAGVRATCVKVDLSPAGCSPFPPGSGVGPGPGPSAPVPVPRLGRGGRAGRLWSPSLWPSSGVCHPCARARRRGSEPGLGRAPGLDRRRARALRPHGRDCPSGWAPRSASRSLPERWGCPAGWGRAVPPPRCPPARARVWSPTSSRLPGTDRAVRLLARGAREGGGGSCACGRAGCARAREWMGFGSLRPTLPPRHPSPPRPIAPRACSLGSLPPRPPGSRPLACGTPGPSSRGPPGLGRGPSPRSTYLVDPASSICLSQRLSHACLSTHGRYSETANGSLNQLWFLWSLAPLLLG